MKQFGLHVYPGIKRDAIITVGLIALLVVIKLIGI